jgi:hypothetical protein
MPHCGDFQKLGGFECQNHNLSWFGEICTKFRFQIFENGGKSSIDDK